MGPYGSPYSRREVLLDPDTLMRGRSRLVKGMLRADGR